MSTEKQCLSTVDQILAEVRANLAKLDGCNLHDFHGVTETAIQGAPGKGAWFRDYRCSRCGGKVSASAHHWYQRGLEHGKAGGK